MTSAPASDAAFRTNVSSIKQDHAREKEIVARPQLLAADAVPRKLVHAADNGTNHPGLAAL